MDNYTHNCDIFVCFGGFVGNAISITTLIRIDGIGFSAIIYTWKKVKEHFKPFVGFKNYNYP